MLGTDYVWQRTVPEFYEALSSSGDTDGVLCATVAALRQIGYDFLAYARMNPAGAEDAAGPQPEVAFVNYPQSWIDQYYSQKFDSIDPVVRRSKQIGQPFRWGDLACPSRRPSRDEVRVLEHATEAGLHDGFTVPLLYPSGHFGLVSFASQDNSGKPPEVFTALSLVAAMMHQSYLQCAETGPVSADAPRLTRRELECLRWIAEGKSSWDIGQILAISECTVNYHVQKVLRKFGTSNRIVAVCIAMRHGLI